MNVADSEVVASVMGMAGYETTEKLEEADAVFLNTCSVRDNAEQKILSRLEFLHSQQRKGKKLIIGVLGCMAERVKEDLLSQHGADLVCGPDSYLSLPDLIAQAELGQKAINVELSLNETYKNVIPQRICGPHIGGFVSIMRGCNNFCHYCIVPYTRGRERSRDVESILRGARPQRPRLQGGYLAGAEREQLQSLESRRQRGNKWRSCIPRLAAHGGQGGARDAHPLYDQPSKGHER